MPYIHIVEPEQASGPLKEIYDEIASYRGGRVPPAMKAASLHPDAMLALKRLNEAVTFGGSTLGRRKEELIATVVSRINDCDY